MKNQKVILQKFWKNRRTVTHRIGVHVFVFHFLNMIFTWCTPYTNWNSMTCFLIWYLSPACLIWITINPVSFTKTSCTALFHDFTYQQRWHIWTFKKTEAGLFIMYIRDRNFLRARPDANQGLYSLSTTPGNRAFITTILRVCIAMEAP